MSVIIDLAKGSWHLLVNAMRDTGGDMHHEPDGINRHQSLQDVARVTVWDPSTAEAPPAAAMSSSGNLQRATTWCQCMRDLRETR